MVRHNGQRENQTRGEKQKKKIKRMKMLACENRMLVHICANCKTTIEIREREKSPLQQLILILGNSIGFNQVALHCTFLNKIWPRLIIQINKKICMENLLCLGISLLQTRSKSRYWDQNIGKNFWDFF